MVIKGVACQRSQFGCIYGAEYLDKRHDLRSVELCSKEGIYGLFNGVVSTTDCVASKARMISM